MSLLSKVNTVGQQVAEAIATVLQIEVEIIDDQLVRIAGTDRLKEGVGQPLQRGLINKYVLDKGGSVIINRPGAHELCGPCPLVNRCFYLGYIVYPIQLAEDIIGTISLVAFSEKQREILLKDLYSHTSFVARMGELLSGKVRERELLDGQVVMANQLQAVLDAVHEGVLALDAAGKITHCNASLASMCGLEKEAVLGRPLESVWDEPSLLQELRAEEGSAPREISGQIGGRKFHFIMTAKPIIGRNREQIGLVASFHDYGETEKLAFRLAHGQSELTFNQIIGESPSLREVKERAAKIAVGNSTVLICGESGTGKEVFARAIHAASPFGKKMFVPINCGAIPEALLESELFGYEAGAFTGARPGGKPGKFELADGGTIFLDEIGNMPLYLQAKLLRVLQERRIERVGGTETIPLNIRIIAATNADLAELVAKGAFREDLFYRLNVIPIVIPPLRERKEDILPLLHHYLTRYSLLLHKNITGLTKDASRLCQKYPWPGNVRELINAVEYAVNLEEGSLIAADSLPVKITAETAANEVLPLAWPQGKQIPTLAELEREAILRALDDWGRCETGIQQAAASLGLSRATIYRRIKKYDLEI